MPSAAFVDDIVGTALELIEEFGSDVVLRNQQKVPTAAGGAVTKTPVDYTMKGVLDGYHAREIDGQTIRRGDRKLLVAAASLAVEPGPDWSVFLGTTSTPEHRVVNVETTYVGDTPALYTLQVRR